jgi:hypothetical protein
MIRVLPPGWMIIFQSPLHWLRCATRLRAVVVPATSSRRVHCAETPPHSRVTRAPVACVGVVDTTVRSQAPSRDRPSLLDGTRSSRAVIVERSRTADLDAPTLYRWARHFLAQHRPRPGGSGTPSCIPIVAVQAPPLPDERRFYQAILSMVFAPFRPSNTAGNLQFEVVQLPSAGGVENADHRRDSARAGGTNARAAALSQCHQELGNELQIPIGAPARTMRSMSFSPTRNFPIASGQHCCGVGR